ncbi:MAG: 60S ribosomal export protein NMD3 [Halobacteriota archaeon]
MRTVPCPDCGAEIHPDSHRCDACYARDIELLEVPGRVEIDVCVDCGSYDLGGGWTSEDAARPEEEIAIEAVEDALGLHVEAERPSISLAVERRDPNTYVADVTAGASVRGNDVVESREIEVRVNRTTCTTCSRRSGGYYESVVQLRADGRDPTEDEIERAIEIAYGVAGRDYGDRETFVTKTEEVAGGVDVYMSTTASGRQVADRLAAEHDAAVSDSATLVGEREGEELYRVTYAVSLPRYVEGDVVELEGTPLLVESSGRLLRCLDLETGERATVDPDDVEQVGSVEDARRTQVVSQSEDEIQVLDPETMETVTLLRPEYVGEQETVAALSTEEGVVLLPSVESASNKKP